MSVVEELSGDGSRIVTSWKRTTVADGDWLQHNTIGPLNERDVFLAEKIDELSGNADEKLNEEIEARKNADTFLSGTIDTFSGNYETFKSNVESSARTLNTKIDNEITRATNKEGELNAKITQTNTRIDNLEAATDVIAVFGTYEEFTAASASTWQQTVTDNDFIKVIRDDNYQPNQNDPDYQTTDDDVYQVYYEYHKTNHDGWIGWSAIGSLDPYYSVSEIDEKFDDLSYVSSISADETEVGFDFHKGDGTLTTFKLKEGPNIVFTPGTNDLTISALPGTKTYNIDDTDYDNDMFWGNDNNNAAYSFLRSGDTDWGTMDEIIDCFNNNIPVYINEYNETDSNNYSNYSWKLNTIKTFTADGKKHIKMTFENEHEETNYYGYLEWQEGAYGPVVNSNSGYSKAALSHDSNLSGDGTVSNELGLNSAVNVYVPAVQDQNYSANVQIGYTPNNLPFDGLYQRDYVGVALTRKHPVLNDDVGFQLDELGLHLNSIYSPDQSTITSYSSHFTMYEYFALNSAYWNARFKNITAFDVNGDENPIRLSELKLSAGQGLSFKMSDHSNWSGPALWAPPGANIPNTSGYRNLTLSINDSIITSAAHGQVAYETLGSAKISANSSPAFTGLLSNGFRISAGNNLTITTTSNNTIQINAKPTGLTSISAGGNGSVNKNYTDNLSLSATAPVKFVTAANNVLGVGVDSATLSAGPGIIFTSAAQNTMGIKVNYTTTDGYVTELNGIPLSAGANYTQGRCIEIDSDNSIKLSANVSATSYYTYEGATTDFSACTISSNGIEFIRGGSNTNYPYYRNALEGTAINIRYDNKNGGIEDVDFKSSTIVYSQTARAPGITFSVTGNWSNIISASKLTPGSGIEIIHTTNDNEIYLTANKYTYQTTATQEGRPVVIPHEVTACSSLELRATYPENPTDVAKNVIVLYNNTNVGSLIPTPPSYSYGQHNNYYLAAQPSGPNSQERHWEPVSSITANCISGNGTITAMVTATQPGSNANVLYLI